MTQKNIEETKLLIFYVRTGSLKTKSRELSFKVSILKYQNLNLVILKQIFQIGPCTLEDLKI